MRTLTLILAALGLALGLSLFAQEPADDPEAAAIEAEKLARTVAPERLLTALRRPALQDSWAIMQGELRHSRRGQDTQAAPIEVRARFSPRRYLAQLIFNEQEWYSVSQVLGGDAQPSVVQDRAGHGLTLADVGIRPSDITMSFLYGELLGEGEPERYRTLHCRVLKLALPQAKETLEVAVSTRYLFPTHVRWYRQGETEPYRELEFVGFKKLADDVVMVREIRLKNPGWRTNIEFADFRYAPVTEAQPPPADLFRRAPAK